MTFNMDATISLNKIKDTLRMMAKSEGGIGFDEGLVNFDHIAQLIHFQLNENNGVVMKSEGDENHVKQNNLATDKYMLALIKKLRHDEMKGKAEKDQGANDQNKPGGVAVVAQRDEKGGDAG